MKKRVIIIDALNAYLRSYIVNPSLSINGDPIGGLKGFMGSLQVLCRQMKPDKIVIAWDGPGGSQRRKAINKGYKEGRNPIRPNRSVRLLSEEEELRNKVWQQTRLIEYLNHVPVSQIMLEGIEADDIIAHACNILKGWEKVIISSDKDFIQCCNEETVLYRPIQKKVMNKKTIVEQYGIHPTNFALARAIAGDKSDNLPGVPRAGLKTIARRFPFLKENKHMFDRVFKHCKTVDSNVRIYKDVLDNKKLVESNYKLMQLYAPSLSPQSKRKISEAVNDMLPEFNKTGILSMMSKDGFGIYDFTDLFSTFRKIVVDSK